MSREHYSIGGWTSVFTKIENAALPEDKTVFSFVYGEPLIDGVVGAAIEDEAESIMEYMGETLPSTAKLCPGTYTVNIDWDRVYAGIAKHMLENVFSVYTDVDILGIHRPVSGFPGDRDAVYLAVDPDVYFDIFGKSFDRCHDEFPFTDDSWLWQKSVQAQGIAAASPRSIELCEGSVINLETIESCSDPIGKHIDLGACLNCGVMCPDGNIRHFDNIAAAYVRQLIGSGSLQFEDALEFKWSGK